MAFHFLFHSEFHIVRELLILFGNIVASVCLFTLLSLLVVLLFDAFRSQDVVQSKYIRLCILSIFICLSLHNMTNDRSVISEITSIVMDNSTDWVLGSSSSLDSIVAFVNRDVTEPGLIFVKPALA